MIDKETIKRNFSRCAPYYDKYSSIQNICATQLIAKIKTNSFAEILEIGCGTGNYTKLLRKRFPQAKIKAIDISFEMLKKAKQKLPDKMTEFITADGETVDFNERFDIISSNASFQWFENLTGTLLKYRDLLDKNGLIFFSQFGPATFSELNASLQKLLGEGASINSCKFIEKERLEEILQGVFREVEVERKIYQERHNSLSELLKKIKYTGVGGQGCGKVRFWTAKMVDRLERIYKEKFKDIKVTYEVIFCQGIK